MDEKKKLLAKIDRLLLYLDQRVNYAHGVGEEFAHVQRWVCEIEEAVQKL